MPLHLILVYGGLAAGNQFCIFGIFKWRKTAFEGLVVFSVLAARLHLMGGRFIFAILALMPSIVLYFALHLEGEDQGCWNQLE